MTPTPGQPDPIDAYAHPLPAPKCATVGWVCPTCRTPHAPHIPTCTHCKPHVYPLVPAYVIRQLKTEYAAIDATTTAGVFSKFLILRAIEALENKS